MVHLVTLLTSLIHCRLRINADQKIEPKVPKFTANFCSSKNFKECRTKTGPLVCVYTHITYINI